MTQSNTPSSPGVPAPMSTVWPPSGTVIPFPLPWGQTGCCPPGGMDALMKCYCDIQAASAFIGQIMIDQINNNPDVTAAIIAAIEKSGSSLPLVGVTNGSNAQPGQVGEYVQMSMIAPFPAGDSLQTVTLGILQPGDWDCWMWFGFGVAVDTMAIELNPLPAGFANAVSSVVFGGTPEAVAQGSITGRASLTVPTLIPYQVQVGGATAASQLNLYFGARRRR